MIEEKRKYWPICGRTRIWWSLWWFDRLDGDEMKEIEEALKWAFDY